jgi:hypothetical protein
MSVSVIVPRTPGIKDRDEIWQFLRPRFCSSWQIIETDDPIKSPLGFNKAAAINIAIPHIKHEVVIVHDSDVWCDDLCKYINVVKNNDGVFVTPHNITWKFNQEKTKRLLDGETLYSKVDGEPQPVNYGGGIVLLRKVMLEQHPLDLRFQGWGAEDSVWYQELKTFYKFHKGDSILWHFYHKERSHDRKEINRTLYNRYVKAAKNINDMKKLMLEKPAMIMEGK